MQLTTVAVQSLDNAICALERDSSGQCVDVRNDLQGLIQELGGQPHLAWTMIPVSLGLYVQLLVIRNSMR